VPKGRRDAFVTGSADDPARRGGRTVRRAVTSIWRGPEESGRIAARRSTRARRAVHAV
jgi:hypothetical protein